MALGFYFLLREYQDFLWSTWNPVSGHTVAAMMIFYTQ